MTCHRQRNSFTYTPLQGGQELSLPLPCQEGQQQIGPPAGYSCSGTFVCPSDTQKRKDQNAQNWWVYCIYCSASVMGVKHGVTLRE